jgi:hypothetical protein
MHHQSSRRALFIIALTALSVFSVFAGDIPLHQDTKVTGKLSIDKGSVFIDLGDTGIAVVDGKPSTIAALKKQSGKIITLHGTLNKMDGVHRMKYGTELILGLDD